MGSNPSKKAEKPTKTPTVMEVKTYIMVTQGKLTLNRNKKVQSIKKKKQEIIECLKERNLDVAKAKMDSMIREEDSVTVYDILGTLCEILKERVTYLFNATECPEDIRAPLLTIIYASTRIDLEELHKLRELIRTKYGDEFIAKGDSNDGELVNRNVIEKLKVKPIADTFITIRLKQLCKEQKLEIDFPSDYEQQIDPFVSNIPQQPQGPQSYNPYGDVNPYADNNPYTNGNLGFPGNNLANPYSNIQINNINLGAVNQINPNQGGNLGGFGTFSDPFANQPNQFNQGGPTGFGGNANQGFPRI